MASETIAVPYKEVASVESVSGLGAFGVKVFVSMERDLTEHDKTVFDTSAEAIYRELLDETAIVRAEKEGTKQKTRQEFRDLFGMPVYMKEIPNGYWTAGSGVFDPWYEVTTNIGVITVGWRKRVIQISWEQTILREMATDLFVNEEVTKLGWMIHAWNYEKAKEYIRKILQEGQKLLA